MTGKQFIYNNIRVDDSRLKVSFDYSVETDEKTFELTETLTLPEALPESSTVDRLLRALHLALGISYYKTFIPPKIDHAYSMDNEEATFWNDVFKNGLGEFLFKNNLQASQLAQFSEQKGAVNPDLKDDIEWQESVLLGIGGGKDSIVAGELLKELDLPQKGFVLATGDNRGQAQAVADKMNIEMLGIERRLDQQILEMNSLEGAYNGHVPISLVFALVGCLTASTNGSRYVVVANEASASIPHIKHEGSDINHQWSKSLEFEKKFQHFVHSSISAELDYFSAIRPLTSIAIAKLFSNYPVYFETFTSDNSLFKIKQEARSHPRWSDNSPKSLSSYILLAPWIEDEDLLRTFGQDFLARSELETLFLELLGVGEKPVLDCVGTPDELRLSISLLYSKGRFIDSPLMSVAKQRSLIIENLDGPLAAALELSTKHALPEKLKEKVMTLIKEKL